MPAMAPQALVRFHQIDSTSTGKAADALKASDHRKSWSGSAGAAIASQTVTKAAPSKRNARRAMRRCPARLGAQAVDDVLGQMAAIATRAAASAASAAARAPASAR